MDDHPPGAADLFIKKSKPINEITDQDIMPLARCHRIMLPQTAGSMAGNQALSILYKTLRGDPSSQVLWHPGSPDEHQGAFASATIDLRGTEHLIKRSLPLSVFFLLSLHMLVHPFHLLARRGWESTIPARGAGYILTIGVTDHAKARHPLMRGRTLIGALENWFRESGVSASWVDTEADNTRAARFYRSLGYEFVSRLYGHLLFRKTLS